MKRKLFLHQILKTLLDAAIFTTTFEDVTDGGIGAEFGVQLWILGGICDYHHLTKGRAIVINGENYIVRDFDVDAETLTIEGTESVSGTSFAVPNPFFFHGTPMQTEIELEKTEDNQLKVPMVYLPEPVDIEEDGDLSSSIDRSFKFKLCFLCEADHDSWSTDTAFKYAIRPMENLKQDLLQLIEDSGLFYSVEQTNSTKHYAKFGINVQDFGTKNQYFTQDLAGVGMDIKLEMYKDDSCSDCGQMLLSFAEDCPDCPDCPDDSILGANLIPYAIANQFINQNVDGTDYGLGTIGDGGGWIQGTDTDTGEVAFFHDVANDGSALKIELPEPSPLNTAYFLRMKVVTYAGMETEDIGIVITFDGGDYFPVIRETFDVQLFSRTFVRPENPVSGPVYFIFNTIGPDNTAGWRGYVSGIEIRTMPTNNIA